MLCRLCAATLVATVSLSAADPVVPTANEVDALIAKASAFILAQAQPNGALVPGAKYVLGVTGLAAEALAAKPNATATSDPKLAKALAFVNGFRQPDGGVYDPAEGLGNYCPAIALLLWSTSGSADPAAVTAAQNYIWGLQNRTEDSPAAGGIGYGSKGPGHEDLSNTSFAVQALRASGVPANEPRMQQALKFLERCQDLSSVNKLPWAQAGGSSGGAVYSPEESKASGSWDRNPPKAGEAPPKLTPYGSMTYALISTYIILDLKRDDPRVAAALNWAKANYQFDRNPGIVKKDGQEGLFYYYRLVAKTYDLLDLGSFQLNDGSTVDWRGDLFAALSKRARIEGGQASWTNPADRWAEDSPVLVTGYVLKALKNLRASL